ncbi:MAG: HAMP domain-containing sensor histidine kinase [Marinoscillum sp.]
MKVSNPKDTIDNLEKVLFEVICLVIIVVMIQSSIQVIILNNGFVLSNIIHLSVTMAFGSMFYLSRFRSQFERLRIPLIIICNITLTFFWFRGTGFYGATGLGASIVAVISVLLFPDKYRKIGLVLLVLELSALVLLQVTTDLIRKSPNNNGGAISYLVILLGLVLLVNYLKVEYDRIRKKSMQQKEGLADLNRQLILAEEDKLDAIKTLQATQTRLIDSEKMASVGRLTAGLAHELNNPLNFIGGNVRPIIKDLDEIKDTLPDEILQKNKQVFQEIEQLLDNVYNGSKRATDVINNLLKISPRGKGTETSNLLVNDLIHRTCLLLKSSHPGIEIKHDMDSPVYVQGNAVEINQVLLNILKNAIDAVHPKRGKINVLLYTEDTHCLIQISDNGKGVPEQYQSQIFEPFFTTKEEGKGTGLGLYISYGIIKKHGGELAYETLTKGSLFKISLPLATMSTVGD